MSSTLPSLLDRQLEQLNEAGRGLKTTTRVCIIGKLADGVSATSFSSWCQSAITSSTSGLLILLPNAWIQTIEGPQEDIPPLLRLLNDSSHVSAARVISSQEDIPGRCFPHWTSVEANAQRSNYAEIEGEDGIAELLADTSIGALRCTILLAQPVIWYAHVCDTIFRSLHVP